MTDLGPAAPSSVICYEGAFPGDALKDHLLLCQFNLHKVSRHEVVPKGGSYITKDFDFLSSPDLDFHPTDVLNARHGDLLVVDTGGWYKLCCPTSQLEKPEVPGAIYRVRQTKPRWSKTGHSVLDSKGIDFQRNRERFKIEAIGRRGGRDRETAESLLNASVNERDRALTHAIRYALWELDTPALIERLADVPNRPRLAIAAAIWAIFQQPSYAPKVFDAARLLSCAESPEPELAAAARMALGKRPEYASKVVDWLKQRLTGKLWADGGWEPLRPLIVAWLGRSDMQYLIAEWTANRDPKVRSYCWSLMAEHRAKSVPSSWREAASRAVASADAEELAAMMPIVRRAVGDAKLIEALRKRSSDRSLSNESRFALLTLAPSRECDQETFGDLTESLGSDRPVALRLAAADALGAAKLTPSQATVLTAVLLECGPLEIERLLPAFTATKNANVGEALVAALERAKARKALRIDDVKKRLEMFGPSLKPAIDRLAAKFAADRAGESKRLDELTNKLLKGDAKRGLLVFNGTKASCRACHKLGYVGGDLGPDLSKIGSIRSRRDLLESTVFPNASFVRSYEPTLLQLHDGRNVSGLVRRETAEEIVLATGLNMEQRIAKKEIEARLAGTVSIMPTGMDQQLSPQELADLIAFLESAK
jgi:putative heme-binding domain-containing protein